MAVPPHIQDLTDKLEGQIAEAILEAIRDIKSEVKLKEVVDALTRGNAEEVIRILNLDESFLDPVYRAIASSYLASGASAVQVAIAQSPKANRLVVRFSGNSPEVAALIQAGFTRAATAITSASKDAIREIVAAGVMNGRHPSSIAIDIIGRLERGSKTRVGGVLGLNTHLVSYLEAARQELESGDPSMMRNYLTRALRDKRYDSAVEIAIEKGKKLKTKLIQNALSEYSDGLLQFRARTIARTEAISAMNGGRHQAFAQMVKSGKIDERDITRKWRSGGDDRTRDTHRLMDDPSYNVKGLTEPFVSPSGARMMHPGDSTLGAPPEEIINCRCYEEIKVDHVAAQARRERGL